MGEGGGKGIKSHQAVNLTKKIALFAILYENKVLDFCHSGVILHIEAETSSFHASKRHNFLSWSTIKKSTSQYLDVSAFCYNVLSVAKNNLLPGISRIYFAKDTVIDLTSNRVLLAVTKFKNVMKYYFAFLHQPKYFFALCSF